MESAEKIGLAIGLSHFIIGVTIISFGTSFPELFTGVVAVLQGVPELVIANALGSNIANILLVVGLSSIVGGKLVVSKSLIDLDLPLLVAATTLLLATIIPFRGGEPLVTGSEGMILAFGYLVYMVYTILYQEDVDDGLSNDLKEKDKEEIKLELADFTLLFLGIVLLTFSSNYLVESVVALSRLHQIAVGAISIVAVAVGTTLPELFVSIRAVLDGDSEMALGNVFGSNIFNGLIVVGIPAIVGDLPLDTETFKIGLPFMVFATLLFTFSGISKRIHAYEGAFYLLLYGLFIIKIFGIF